MQESDYRVDPADEAPREESSLLKELRNRYPHGHPAFTRLALDEIRLHSEKNRDYAQGGPPLGNFYRVASIAEMYPGMDWESPFGVAILYALKQLDAVLNARGRRLPLTLESAQERLRDWGVYAKLASLLLSDEQSLLSPPIKWERK